MAKTLYYNGTIITMSGSEPESAEAVLTENDKILAVGSLEAVQAAAESGKHQDTPILKDLKGAVMLPAFIDSHSHITAVARVLSFAMLQEAESFDGIIGILNRFKEERKLEPGDWIIGTGYDHNNLKEGRHPDRFILDAAFPENPVMVTHASGHMGVANSLALEKMGITADTKDPSGGRIGRAGGKNTGEPDGYLEETAFTGASSVIPEPGTEQLGRQLQAAEQLYLKHGITTIQDGRTGKEEWKLLKYAAEQGLLHADVVAYAALNDAHELTEENPAYTGAYCNHLRIGGYKIFLDGSPQGRTAWVSRPYEGEPEGYCGYPIFKDKEVQSYFETAFREGRQLLVHCNGDAAAQQMIGACRMAADTTGQDPAKTRPVMIHAQLVRPDQLKEMERLSITASFFTAHTWYWGDVHLKNFGEARALKISPARTAIDDGVNVTFHQDSPVIQPDMLETVWCAVNRISSGGHPMGLLERVTPYEALKAVTSNAAYQYGEENEKGTIEPGKTADFVILSSSPMTVLPEEIKKIRVLETIKGGKVLYKSI
ncbi:amidohydrolase [[Clostridium] symbiosum]|uniref:amidohydrolase n=1 Tax=Clostridium symbiosum TaxID=1512 RepID=UPI0034A5B4FF